MTVAVGFGLLRESSAYRYDVAIEASATLNRVSSGPLEANRAD
jgi:hypothetical protein